MTVAVLAGATAGCRESLQAFSGSTEVSSRGRAEEMFSALGARVADPYRDLKFDSARVRIARAAVLPSRVWRDTSVWTSSTPARRQLAASGRFSGGRYRLEAMATAPFPDEPAEARHVINLSRLSDDEFAWDTDVPYAIGSVTAAEVGAFVAALFAGAEGRSEAEVRADYRAIVPLASAVMGQLFRVDSIHTTHLADRSTLTSYAATMTPAGVEKRYPEFAKYLRRYVHTAKMKWTLTDAGGTYIECRVAEGHLVLRVRTASGRMLALTGPARVMPDSLILNGEMTMKISRFTVGFKNYHADFHIIRTAHERAWSVISTQEPEWVLPLITERLLRTPLKRPFQGSGARFRIGVRDSVGGQTILDRRLHLDVQESALLRFLGRLGAIAISDYAGKTEREEMAWLREVFTALVADMRGA